MKTILIIILTCFSTLIYGQNEIYLTVKHKYKRVDIKYGYIGLTTSNDTIDYHEQKELSSKIYRVTKDSLYLIRPKVYHCELVDSVEKLSIRRRDSYIYLRTIRELRKKLLAYLVVDTFELKGILLSDITSITYPQKGSVEHLGCIMCIFAPLIPIYNVYYIIDERKYYHPKRYVLTDKKWKLYVTGPSPNYKP